MSSENENGYFRVFFTISIVFIILSFILISLTSCNFPITDFNESLDVEVEMRHKDKNEK